MPFHIINLRQSASAIKKRISGDTMHSIYRKYYSRFKTFAFIDNECNNAAQYEASITRLYHTIEKGLSYENYRPGFGENNVYMLILTLEEYASKGYNTSEFFYETALSCLHEYIKKNKNYGLNDSILERRIQKLPGKANMYGGTIKVAAPIRPEELTYNQMMKTRHSIRHFSEKPLDIDLLKKAIELAQYTPSACNRQGWKTRIIASKEAIEIILSNQNGNQGFGHEFDKILVVTADLCTQQRSREIFQAFIDGGMYAESILNCLYSYGIGAVPLSASLTFKQEKRIREALCIEESEVLILFVGCGNYPEGEFLTTSSARKPINVDVI